MSTIVLVDLSAAFAQAWHGIPRSEPAGAPHDAAVARCRRIAEEYEYAAICADSPKNWRKDMSPDYKAQRESHGEAYVAQLKRCAHTLAADGFVVWQIDGYEADDVIASATVAARKAGLEVVIATEDKDLLQLVTDTAPSVTCRKLSDGTLRGPAEVREKFGVGPEQLGDWLAVVGDKSDNVAGVPRVGPVGASAVLRHWGSLVSLYTDPDSLKDEAIDTRTRNAAQAIIDHESTVSLARRLVTLRTDAPIRIEDAMAERQAQARPVATQWEATSMDDGRDDTHQSQLDGSRVETQVEVPAEPPRQTAAIAMATPAAVAMPAPTSWETSLEPRSPAAAWKMAEALHNARVFPQLDSAERVFAAILLGRSLGVGMMQICQQVHVLKDKLTLHATIIEGLAMSSPLCRYLRCVESTSESATYETFREGHPEPTRRTYTIDDARAAGLLSNPQYTKRPAVMLRHRCATDLVREVYPDVVGGLYDPNELE